MGSLSIGFADDGETLLAKVVQQRELSPADLARESGLAVNTVHKLLRGDGTPTFRTASKVTEALHRLAPRQPALRDLFPEGNQIDVAVAAVSGVR
jgi:transcriptional regulator with XRE-family HTH domain